jgi:hypothetical protein
LKRNTITGKVVKKRFASGSKSDRDAVILRTDKGEEYVLRREGGNPFTDPSLDELVGKQVRLKGLIHGYTLIFSDCEPIEPQS